VFWEDADDRHRHAVDVHGQPNDVGAAVQASLPEVMADHRDGGRSGRFVCRREVSAHQRSHAEQAERIRGVPRQQHVDRPARIRAKRDGLAAMPEGNVRECLGLLAPHCEVGVPHWTWTARQIRRLPHCEEQEPVAAVGERKAADYHRVSYREHDDIQRHGDGQRDDGGERKPAIAAQPPKGMPKIEQQSVQMRTPARVFARFQPRVSHDVSAIPRLIIGEGSGLLFAGPRLIRREA
jgi:hypothetical protein